jgi:intracellular sulfur oxidation DsrE/DsrF family protein
LADGQVFRLPKVWLRRYGAASPIQILKILEIDMKNMSIATPKIGLTAAAAIFAVCLPLGAAAATGAYHGATASRSHYNVIFHLDAGGTPAIKKTLTNIENILHDPRLAGKLHVELIANSNGFDVYVKNNGFEDKLKQLQGEGVILAQCANTLKEKHVDRKDLYSFISIVPSGMGEIAIREAEGWAYIHPSAPPEQL